MTLCRHCGLKPANRPRGLCWACYENRSIRDLYPRAGVPWQNRGSGLSSPSQEPSAPLQSLPGTAQKVDDLMDRAARGFRLWHTKDAQR